MEPYWYRNAVVYQIDPAFFRDSDGDGWGDLSGVTERLEHVRGLGATCIWLLPFYSSPYRDGGYDVTDHLSVDQHFGDVADVAALLDRADELGLRVILDLVAQHTSVEHPWFQEARKSRDSPYRDYYVWADEPHETGVEPVFPTVEDSVWAWDDEAGQYYRHTFYSHEPDLELGNPRVREEMFRIMGFWLRLGVAGFRVDALPYMVERAAAVEGREDGYWLLEEMREFVTSRRPDAVLLGEVDVPVEQYADYFGDSNRLTLLLNFWANNYTFLALSREEADPLRSALAELPPAPGHAAYANFLRNHDELDLERLDAGEREQVVGTFAPQDDMRAYGRGIRRRLAPMLGGDDRRIGMAHALMFSLPGTPVMLYGDEIAMGEDLERTERRAVRVPMQWTDAPNGGFSEGAAEDLAAQPIADGPFGYRRRNVVAQSVQRDSLLAKVGDIVRTRLGCTELGAGRCTVLDTDAASVLALRHDDGDLTLLTVVNLGPDDAEVPLPDDLRDLVDVLADGDYAGLDTEATIVPVHGHGYRWLRRRDQLFS